MEIKIEMFFTHIDAGIDCWHRYLFGHDLALHAGRSSPSSVQDSEKDGRAELLNGADTKGLTAPSARSPGVATPGDHPI